MANSLAKIGNITCGDRLPFMLIAGPCVIENRDLTMQIAEHLKNVCQTHHVPLVFKASFDKANRTSLASYRGPGIDKGLAILQEIKEQFQVPVTTDIHEASQAESAGQVCDLLQIPAFLARQTDLLVAAAKTGKPVNVKKGQFMAPGDMKFVVEKLRGSNCENILLTERGTFFGYGQLVNDLTGLAAMKSLGVPVVFDATHSVQRPSGPDGITLGNRDMVAPMARAAIAFGIDALFMETHPNPESSPSDAANIYPLAQIGDLLAVLNAIEQSAQPHLQTQ